MSLLLNNKRRKTQQASSDPYWNNVVLFLKGDGTNGSTNIVDSSPSPKTISVFGNTQISTAQSKYGGSSIYLDGNGDYVTANASTDSINIRTDSYTLELWFMSLANQTQFLCGEAQGNLYLQYFMNNFFFGDGSTNNIAIGSILQLNTWTHIAISFNGITTRLFKDGIQLHSSTTLLKNYLWTTFCVGARLGGSPTGHSYCYLDSFRITKGVARYTSNFNPETDTYLNV